VTPPLCLSPEEIAELTAGLRQPHAQAERLKADGFWRARVQRGRVVLERAHYEAVCAGALPPGQNREDTERPRLRPVTHPQRKAA